MNTITQGYSVDVARGLAHPDSVEARRASSASAKVANVNRQTDINRACITIRNLCRTERDVIDVLHALAGGLNAAIFKSSDTVEIVEQLDVLADEIEFRGEA